MKKIRKNLKWITIIIVVIIIIIGGVIKVFLLNSFNGSDSNVVELEIETLKETIEVTENVIIENVFVDIKGAVNNPGVYEIAANKKIIDVVGLAGGFTEQADTSMINLAKKVSDEMVIIIYTEDEVKNSKEENTVIKIIEKECVCPEINNDACLNQNNDIENDNSLEDGSVKVVNINSATLEELMTISGIGESKAKAIIAYREENGVFKSIEDIMNVSGIGESLYEKIKDNITV